MALDTEFSPEYFDSITLSNLIFREKLLKYSKIYSTTFQYDFPLLDSLGIKISTSHDHKFRIYSWTLKNWASSKSYNNIYQFQGNTIKSVCFLDSNDEAISDKHDDTCKNFYEIIDLDTKFGKIYIGLFNSISGSINYEGLKLFAIIDNALNDTLELFKNKKYPGKVEVEL